MATKSHRERTGLALLLLQPGPWMWTRDQRHAAVAFPSEQDAVSIVGKTSWAPEAV